MPLEVGSVYRFWVLWPDKAQKMRRHECLKGVSYFNVPGKARPVLVVDRCRQTHHGVRHYWVLPFTTKGKREDGSLKEDHVFVGRCINADRESYLVLDVLRYPENLAEKSAANNTHEEIEPYDRVLLAGIVNHVNHKRLRSHKGGFS